MNIEYEGWELDDFDSAKNYRSYQFDLISRFIKGSTAEVGPGNGINIQYYYNQVDYLTLYEPTTKLFSILKRKYSDKNNIKIKNEKFNNEHEKFDTIIYLDVLEHIKEDKKEFLNAYKKLNPEGHMIINVPAYNLLYSDFDRDVNHYKRYNKKDFINLLEGTNYNFLKLVYYDSIGFFLALLSKYILKKNYKGNFKNKISFWNKLIPMSKFIDKITFHSVGKSLICIVKK